MITEPVNRILFVEDDPCIQAVAEIALATVGGFTVRVCSGGREALSVVEGFAPDLILLDVMMPDLDGPATLREMRAEGRGPRVPVVFLTARVQAEEVARYKEMGAIDVIAKPFDPMTLASRIREIWRNRHDQ